MFTLDNTENFTVAQLNTLNAALEIIQSNNPEIETSNIHDALNNTYIDGATVEYLIENVKI